MTNTDDQRWTIHCGDGNAAPPCSKAHIENRKHSFYLDESDDGSLIPRNGVDIRAWVVGIGSSKTTPTTKGWKVELDVSCVHVRTHSLCMYAKAYDS